MQQPTDGVVNEEEEDETQKIPEYAKLSQQ
jgi:hypothetical protein